MLQVCIFGSYEGRLRANKRFFFTLFGAAELRRSTLARRILTERAQDRAVPHNRCLLYTSPSPRDRTRSRMPSSA